MKSKRLSLDVGPGPSPARGTTHAVDVSNDFVELLGNTRRREWGDKAFKRIRYRLADAEKGLPYRDDLFDRVTCNNVLGSYVDSHKAIPHMYKVLKHGGHVSFLVYGAALAEDIVRSMRSTGFVGVHKRSSDKYEDDDYVITGTKK